jgi:hypothetical protein
MAGKTTFNAKVRIDPADLSDRTAPRRAPPDVTPGGALRCPAHRAAQPERAKCHPSVPNSPRSACIDHARVIVSDGLSRRPA